MRIACVASMSIHCPHTSQSSWVFSAIWFFSSIGGIESRLNSLRRNFAERRGGVHFGGIMVFVVHSCKELYSSQKLLLRERSVHSIQCHFAAVLDEHRVVAQGLGERVFVGCNRTGRSGRRCPCRCRCRVERGLVSVSRRPAQHQPLL